MKRLSTKKKFWSVLGAGLLVAAISGSALARQMDSRDVSQQAAQQDRGLTTFLSPLPTLVPEIEPALVGNHDDGNSNGNEDHGDVNPPDHGNAIPQVHDQNNDHSGTVNSNNNNSHDDLGGSVNSNNNRGNQEHGGNINSSDHSNHNDHVSNGSNDRGGEGE